MFHLVRHLFLIAVIVCHAAVTVCGPCLHDLTGSWHSSSPGTGTQRGEVPGKSLKDSADHCLICQYVAQGQLTIAVAAGFSALPVARCDLPDLPTSRPQSEHFHQSPRAPPLAIAPLA
jgi:hypothetical protein